MEIRHFRESDTDALVALWNRRINGCYAAGPLDAAIWTRDVRAKEYFDPEGLILAFEGQRLLAFVHAAFKSSDWIHPDLRMGTITMAGLEPDAFDAGEAAMARAVAYLKSRGALQVEAFAFDFPNTPFYNGLYGGEKAGMDEDHPGGMELMRRSHFKVANGGVIMLCELAGVTATPPDFGRLQFRVAPWQSRMSGLSPMACYGIPEPVRRAELVDADGAEGASMLFWHLDRYNRAAGDRLAVVSYVSVAASLQGTGVGQRFQTRIHQILREEGAARVGLGAGGRNGRAVNFYRKLGYVPVKTAYSYFLDWRHF